jgi:hypothetical protein
MDERLQHGLEMPWRQSMAVRERLRGNGLAARMQRHIDDGGDREQTFFREARHAS